MNKNKYLFVAKIALEFRLSLDNICKLLGKEITEETKMEIFKNISNSLDDYYMIEKYKYLFFYETINEPESSSKIAYDRAVNFIKRYNKVKKDGTKEEIKQILSELTKTEKDFLKIKDKLSDSHLTDEDIYVITKYRIKYSIPRTSFAETHNISKSSLEKRDNLVKDEFLRRKVELLSQFFSDYRKERIRSK